MTGRRGSRGERGFVLVGVVIFVIALTIIGLSLFSLSSYEAQFLEGSIDAEQAYQSAMSGIEHAKAALCRTDPADPNGLQAPGRGLPFGDIVSAVAIQHKGTGPDSLGPVDWNPGEVIELHATARRGAQTRTVSAQFEPRLSKGPYAYLISATGHVSVPAFFASGGTPLDRRFTTGLFGPPGAQAVWEAGTPVNTAWAEPGTTILFHPPDGGVRTASLATPELATYFAAHFADAELVEPILHGSDPPQYIFQGNQNHPIWYRLRADDSYVLQPYELGKPAPEFHIQGLAVLEFPHGFRSEDVFKVFGTGGGVNDVLVIVAGPIGASQGYEDDVQMGFRAWGGIQVDPSVTLIIVSSGNVYLQHYNSADKPSYVSDLTVYARDVGLVGPQVQPGPQPWMSLTHSGAIEGPNGALERLAGARALPGITSAVQRRLDFRPGTWSTTQP